MYIYIFVWKRCSLNYGEHTSLPKAHILSSTKCVYRPKHGIDLVWGESWDTTVISKRMVTADGVAHIWHQCIFRDHNHGLNRPVYVTTVLNKWHICELLQTFDNLFHNKTVVSLGSCAVSMGMLWLNCLTFYCFCFCEKGVCSWNFISCNQAIHIWRVINVP